jgi:hypothetical protein
MAELADAADSKSAEGNLVGVRPPLPAPLIRKTTLRASGRFCLPGVLVAVFRAGKKAQLSGGLALMTNLTGRVRGHL